MKKYKFVIEIALIVLIYMIFLLTVVYFFRFHLAGNKYMVDTPMEVTETWLTRQGLV